MNIEQAKSILHGYRPNGADAGDPTFSEALDLTKKDPVLREWFAKQQAFDEAMCADFEAVPVPAGLCENILTAANAQSAAPRRTDGWNFNLRVGLALAAGVVLVFSVGAALWPKPKLPAANSSLADFVIGDAQHPQTHGGHGEKAVVLNHLLNQPATKLGGPLPMDFASLRDTGCRTLHLEGRDVLEVCFRRNGVGLHYYIARRQDFPTLTASIVPTVMDKKEATLVTWADTANLYLVVTKPGSAVVEKLL